MRHEEIAHGVAHCCSIDIKLADFIFRHGGILGVFHNLSKVVEPSVLIVSE